MKILQRIFDFYLDASIHVALAVFALVQVTALTLNITVDFHLSFFLFFGSISCYNFIKYGLEAEKYILVANSYHKSIQFFSLVMLVLALYHGYFLNISVWTGIGGLLVLTGVYALPVLPKSKNLRSWGGLKIFIVALVWSGATVVLPVLTAKQVISWDVWIETLQRFVFVLILLVPFEIRDLLYDAPDLKTLPQRYGVTHTKTLGAFAAVLFFVVTNFKDDISQAELVSKGLIFLVLGSLMYVTKRHQSRYFASFWVESISIFWWGIVLALQWYT